MIGPFSVLFRTTPKTLNNITNISFLVDFRAMSRQNSDQLYQNLVGDSSFPQIQQVASPFSPNSAQFQAQASQPQDGTNEQHTYVNADFLSQFRRAPITNSATTPTPSSPNGYAAHQPQARQTDASEKYHGLLPSSTVTQQTSPVQKRNPYEDIPDEFMPRARSQSNNQGDVVVTSPRQSAPQQQQQQASRLKFDPRTGLFVPSLRPNNVGSTSTVGGVPSSPSSIPQGSPTRSSLARRDQDWAQDEEDSDLYTDSGEHTPPNYAAITPPTPIRPASLILSPSEATNKGPAAVKIAPLDPSLEMWAKQGKCRGYGQRDR